MTSYNDQMSYHNDSSISDTCSKWRRFRWRRLLHLRSEVICMKNPTNTQLMTSDLRQSAVCDHIQHVNWKREILHETLLAKVPITDLM